MIRLIRPGGSIFSARHLAGTASRWRSSFGSIVQTSSASQEIILSTLNRLPPARRKALADYCWR
jgi:hypothetical protein